MIVNTPQSKVVSGLQGDSIYTCPMHSEVRQAASAICAKCGMTLEHRFRRRHQIRHLTPEPRAMAIYPEAASVIVLLALLG